MKVKRIVANVRTENLGDAKRFYQAILGLEPLMDLGWIATYGSNAESLVQMSFMKEGGSRTAVPDISIEVDHVDEGYANDQGHFTNRIPDYRRTVGVRRFFVRDPFGMLVNILSHR